jgi:hypothetical protein
MGTRGYFPEGKDDHSFPCSAKVKNDIPPLLNTPSWHGAQLMQRNERRMVASIPQI